MEVNAQFRAAFIEQCKRHNPRIQHYQVIGLDDLEAWVSMESELRHLYFPTIFGLPRFDLRIAFSMAFPGYFSGFSVPAIDSDTVMLAISILNVGTVTSYISTISIEVLIDGERKPLNILDFGETFTSHMRPLSTNGTRYNGKHMRWLPKRLEKMHSSRYLLFLNIVELSLCF